MADILTFLLKASAGIIVMYFFFFILNRRDTSFGWNRFLLLLCLVLPLVLPLLRVRVAMNNNLLNAGSFITTIVTGDSHEDYGTVTTKYLSNPGMILMLVWAAGALLMFLRLVTSLVHTSFIIRRGERVRGGFPGLLVTSESVAPFSFYPFAVIPGHLLKEDGAEDIIEHEFAHLRQIHTLDIILCELVLIFLWFNPAVWMIRKSIAVNHEYLADREVVQKASDRQEYQYRLLQLKYDSNRVTLANNFTNSIKNRIIMINKVPQTRFSGLKNLLMVPVIAVLFSMLSFSSVSSIEEQSMQFSEESKNTMLKYLSMNVIYPAMSRANLVKGQVFVEMSVGKGGSEVKAKIVSPDKIKYQAMPELVVIAYADKDQKVVTNSEKVREAGKLLEEECLRVSKEIVKLGLPEWKDSKIDFTLAFKFDLK